MALRPGARATQAGVRRANLSLVLRTACGADEPLSRADLAATTGLTRATASVLVDLLVADGLLDEQGMRQTGGRGRPATPLIPGEQTMALGLRVDARLLAARVLDLRGRIVAEFAEEVEVADRPPRVVLQRLARRARRLVDGLPPAARVVGVGLALPGLVDREREVLLRAPNLGWVEVRLPGALRGVAGSGAPVHAANEADLAARAFAAPIPGRRGRYEDFLYVSGGVGVGGAAVLGGVVAPGSRGLGGEVGHVCVDPAGPRCGCGSSGCLEQYAGTGAILRAAGLAGGARPADVVRRVEAGDARAAAAVDGAVNALGIALAGVLNVLDLPTVVLGGDLAELAPVVVPGLEQRLRERVVSSSWTQTQLVAASRDSATAATGAALTCLDDVLDDPAAYLNRPLTASSRTA